ncbi:MAG: hypothetical protein PG981_000285 [Wolbachia endosymbiont of Ctenocephalides orientis wCori]|nr:MAG: hypothetical protein PG981_000285 [Wolbachia endosymbiont of Ctenocephalides orientis wCori]
MNSLNLIPNMKTLLKSMIVSADVADFANTPANGFIELVAEELFVKKATQLGREIVNTELLSKEKPLSLAIVGWLQEVLKRDQGFKDEIKGEKGESPSARDVAAELIAGPNLQTLKAEVQDNLLCRLLLQMKLLVVL